MGDQSPRSWASSPPFCTRTLSSALTAKRGALVVQTSYVQYCHSWSSSGILSSQVHLVEAAQYHHLQQFIEDYVVYENASSHEDENAYDKKNHNIQTELPSLYDLHRIID
ncbi:hypothetical protein PoB_002304900 [Plakobranchus ocellatus]|uniref:Uncharacterized protein n=1 Tax=Plakobranchus ocellatus TaxID=259542 RepID=A0AAV3ZQ93_9GAST|nr:hypothetical protein PoB_002304900 [Plakobranchus ocellatus]